MLALVKPQFEVGAREVGPGGIVREPQKHLAALEAVAVAAGRAGFRLLGGSAASITGAQGNQEFFLHLRAGEAALEADRRHLLGGLVDGE